jgi:hypothetical protein
MNIFLYVFSSADGREVFALIAGLVGDNINQNDYQKLNHNPIP